MPTAAAAAKAMKGGVSSELGWGSFGEKCFGKGEGVMMSSSSSSYSIDAYYHPHDS
jgi:hypothetical protein